MSDSGFREIQLSGKHVVFLFMAGAVAAVAIFLLGVSVGKGVARPDTAASPTPTPTDLTAASQAAQLPPLTTPAPGELKYHETLQGKGDAKAVATPSPSASPSATPAAPAAAPVKPAATPTPKTSTAAGPTPAASTTGGWYVPVDAFSSRANATREVEQLKAKGITATMLEASGSGARFKVRVGPMTRQAADAMVQRLRKEGFKPSAPIR